MKLGRLPRIFNPRVPHLSALFGSRRLTPVPPAVDYTVGLATGWGMMGNDQLGDCTCAAYYHARQVWTGARDAAEITESDQLVLQLYEEACGWRPGNPNSDQGGVEQDVLKYLTQIGAPIGPSPSREKLTAFFEVDPRVEDDVKRVIHDCGGCYIGFNVPDELMDSGPPQEWSDTSSNNIIGGHAVWLPGYDATGPTVVSWGHLYKMTWEFFHRYTDESYALVSPAWVAASGMTPAGMTVVDLMNQMHALTSV